MPNKIYPFLLSLIVLIISYQNYVSGTFLMGFDSWHPEFNFNTAFEKSLSVWQEYMGLGTHGEMSFASDLSRNIVLLFFSYFLPSSFLRYLWTFGMLLLGTLGMFYFLRISVLGRSFNFSGQLSFLGALFYLFNLSTLQLFYTSFDGFMTQFGFLPWLFWSGKNLLDGFSRKSLITFMVISFLSTSQAYTGTLFFAFLIFYFLYLLSESLIYPEVKTRVLNLFKIFVIYFLINFFWLGPVMYAIFTGADNVSSATINLLSSEESFLLNKKYGDILSVLELKNFWFDSTDYNTEFQKFDPLLEVWIKHLDSFFVTIIGYFFIGIFLVGFIYSFFVKKFRIFSVLFLVSIFFLSSGVGPLGFVYDFLRENIPLLKEALRFPFTKFSILGSFVYAVLFALGLSIFFEKFKQLFGSIKRAEIGVLLLSFLILILFLARFSPYFDGQLLNPNTKVFLPAEYFRLFEHFQNKNIEERIVLTPVDTYWAWVYYGFGYRGSGFMLYGIKQPLVSRSFDVWNKTNENVYWELNYAISQNDPEILRNIIIKYQIKHFVLDRNVIIPGPNVNAGVEFNDRLQVLLDKTRLVKEIKTFGLIMTVETNLDTSLVSGFKDLDSVKSFKGISFTDEIFKKRGDYLNVTEREESQNREAVAYPFSYLMTNRFIDPVNYEIENLRETVILKPFTGLKYNNILEENLIYEPQVNGREIRFVPNGFSQISYSTTLPQDAQAVFFDNSNILDLNNTQDKTGLFLANETLGRILRISEERSFNIKDLLQETLVLDTCRGYKPGNFSYEFVGESLKISSSGKNSSLCLFLPLTTGVFEEKEFNKIKINLASSLGKYLGYCLLDEKENKCLKEGNLSDKNNFSFLFLSEKKSSDYTLVLYPNFELIGDENFYQISNFVVSKHQETRRFLVSDLKEEINSSREEVELNLSDVGFSSNFQNYENLCPLNNLGDSNIFVNEGRVLYSNTNRVCLNLLEGTDFLLGNNFGSIVYLKYDLKSDKRVPLCAGSSFSCLTIDKLEKGEGKEVLFVLPAGTSSLRVDLESIISSSSEFRVRELKVVKIDLRGISLINSSNSSKLTNYGKKSFTNSRFFSWLYLINLEDSSLRYISLNQENQPGWVALCGSSFCTFSGELNNYGKVWEVKGYQGTVVLIYLPQLLLFFGLVILVFLILINLFTSRR